MRWGQEPAANRGAETRNLAVGQTGVSALWCGPGVACRQLIRLLAENMPLSPWAGLLARGFRRDLNPINADPAFPESEIRVAFLGQAHHSQWRDRSGFSPKFPVGPTTGTQGQSPQAYSAPVPGVKSQTEFPIDSSIRRDSFWTFCGVAVPVCQQTGTAPGRNRQRSCQILTWSPDIAADSASRPMKHGIGRYGQDDQDAGFHSANRRELDLNSAGPEIFPLSSLHLL